MFDFKAINQIVSSKEYLEYVKYHQGNPFGIIKISRDEKIHSNFIAWLMSPYSTHDLNFFPVEQLLKMLVVIDDENNNYRITKLVKSIIAGCTIGDNNITNIKVETEKPLTYNDKKRRIDILIEVNLYNEKIIPIVIENKVDSKTHDGQTTAYYNWAENEYSDKTKYNDVIYVFLKPSYSKTIPDCNKFIEITYQNLVDYIIEPCLWKSSNQQTLDFIKMYLQCLSHQIDYEKGDRIMATSSEERELLQSFYSKNRDLVISLFEMMKDDEDISQDDKQNLEEVINNVIKSRDYTKYEFNNKKPLSKNRMVLEVVKKFINDKNPTYDELLKAFPNEIAPSFGVFRLKKDVKPNQVKQRRYFMDDEMQLSDGNVIVVSTQWGVPIISYFIERARELGYIINQI